MERLESAENKCDFTAPNGNSTILLLQSVTPVLYSVNRVQFSVMNLEEEHRDRLEILILKKKKKQPTNTTIKKKSAKFRSISEFFTVLNSWLCLEASVLGILPSYISHTFES